MAQSPINLNKVRVTIDYVDGHYSMSKLGSRQFAPNISDEEKQEWIDNYTIEIDSNLWDAYVMHGAVEQFWYNLMQGLSNEMREDP